MKVLIVGTYVPDQQYSILGFARILHERLGAYGIETRLISPPEKLAKLGKFHGGLRRWLGHADKILVFPKELKKAAEWADVVHLVDHGLAVYVKHVPNIPHVVTCHDLIAMRAAFGDLPEWKIGGTAPFFQRMIRDGLNNAHHVTCISEATRTQLKRLTQAPPERTSIIYDSLFHDYEVMPPEECAPLLKKMDVGAAPYLFHVGRDVPTKNRIGLVKIFAAARRLPGYENLELVLAGKAVSEEIRQYIAQEKLESVVKIRLHLSNAELRALYSSALALVFPSFTEGFGLPVIEAQACGCPVFASDRAPMTEVGGDAAVYFDPTQFEAAAKIITSTLSVPGKRDEMIRAGFENLERFRPPVMLSAYADIYRMIAEQPLPGRGEIQPGGGKAAPVPQGASTL